VSQTKKASGDELGKRSAPYKRFGVKIRALVWEIQTGQRIEIVGALHVAQREGTREVGHGHCIEGGFHIV
jgi:hypothetical protein